MEFKQRKSLSATPNAEDIAVATMVPLACDLLSSHDKYLLEDLACWNVTGGLWDTDGSFVSAGHEVPTTTLCPC